MVKPLLVVTGGSLLGWAAAVAAAPSALPAATAGVALALPPCLLTLALVDLVGRRSPEGGPAAVMAGVGLRMAWAVAAVSILGPAVEKVGIRRQSLADWTCGFYLLTLSLETAALWGRLARTGPPAKGPP